MRGISHQHAPGREVVGRALHRDHGLGWQQKVIVLQLLPSGKTTDFVVWDHKREDQAMPCPSSESQATGTVSLGMQTLSLCTRLFVLGKMWKSTFPSVDQIFRLQVLSSAHNLIIDILVLLLWAVVDVGQCRKGISGNI